MPAEPFAEMFACLRRSNRRDVPDELVIAFFDNEGMLVVTKKRRAARDYLD